MENIATLAHDYWELLLREEPISATFYGDSRYDDRLDERGPEARERQLKAHQALLRRLKSISSDQLTEEDKVTYDILQFKIEEFIESLKYNDWEWGLDHLFGPHIFWMDLIDYHPLKTEKNYEDLLKRYGAIPASMNLYIADLRMGLRSGRVASYVAYNHVVQQLQTFLAQKPETTRYAECLKIFPNTFSDVQKKDIEQKIMKTIINAVFPAYQKLLNFLLSDYQSKVRSTVGIKFLPQGEAAYAFRIRIHTTTSFTPKELHELGLEELKKNQVEMQGIAKKMGHSGSLREFLEVVKGDRKNYFSREEDILKKHVATLEGMKSLLPAYFKTLPTIKFEIKKMPTFKAPSSPAAYYYPPTQDGSRPGIFWMNTHKPEQWAVHTMESLAYHEAVPGHHLQIALATEQKQLPTFRRHAHFTAYIEGWAHYAERLSDEMGAYSDDLQRLGMLIDQAWRAIRLVIDTGIHYFGWTRDQALQFMREQRVTTEADMENEVDRYIIWPGQALAYKVGQRVISDVREAAKKELKEKFDLREFHDVVLLSGPVPLSILKNRVQAWVVAKKKQP